MVKPCAKDVGHLYGINWWKLKEQANFVNAMWQRGHTEGLRNGCFLSTCVKGSQIRCSNLRFKLYNMFSLDLHWIETPRTIKVLSNLESLSIVRALAMWPWFIQSLPSLTPLYWCNHVPLQVPQNHCQSHSHNYPTKRILLSNYNFYLWNPPYLHVDNIARTRLEWHTLIQQTLERTGL